MFRLHIFVTYRPALKISWFSGNTLVEIVFLLKEVVFTHHCVVVFRVIGQTCDSCNP